MLYGTETGNAEEIAVELGQMAERLHFKTTVDEMDSFKLVGCFSPNRQNGLCRLTALWAGRCFTNVACSLCHIDNGPGRHAKERVQVLEKSQA